jgi:hypothetical protein
MALIEKKQKELELKAQKEREAAEMKAKKEAEELKVGQPLFRVSHLQALVPRTAEWHAICLSGRRCWGCSEAPKC